MGSVNIPKVLKVRLISDISISSRLLKTCATTGMMEKQREGKFAVQASPGYNNVCLCEMVTL